jgi:hypothetical protein
MTKEKANAVAAQGLDRGWWSPERMIVIALFAAHG